MADMDVFPCTTLWRMRGMLGMTQERLARILSEGRYAPFKQPDISRTELGHRGFLESEVQRRATAYFRSRGFDTDPTGAILWVPCAA